MDYSLKKDKLISLYLSRLIPINEIRYKIINRKNKMETEETLDYHRERWDNIAGSHYMIHDTHQGKYSIIHDSINYVVKPDHRLDFYLLTGISYQIVELIHELIKRNFIQADRSCHYKKFLKEDDKLYSQLANLIMKEMKE
jgi:uncharacterized lipoprotein YehR (DUF1307 family)